MALSDEQFEFLKDYCRLIAHAVHLGFKVTAGEMFRTIEQQRIYVETGRSQTLSGYHLKRLAADLNFFRGGELIVDKETLQPLGDFWVGLNPTRNRWGGSWAFKDLGHFERRV
jgi:peptidoglycan L-alanyl-D-glutamate endopeptidase CwlK